MTEVNDVKDGVKLKMLRSMLVLCFAYYKP